MSDRAPSDLPLAGRSSPQREPVVIVGAGFAGLAAATALVDAGRSVVVIEATSHGGGRSRSHYDKLLDAEIDNGQHLVMGCYHDTTRFLRRIGQPADVIDHQANLRVTMIAAGGKRIDLACPPLPAPLHLAAGLLGMRGVGVLHRLAALRAGLLLRGEVRRPDDNESCDAWLVRMGQTRAMRAVFWEPLIWSVLNDDPLVASAAMLVAVLEQAFLGERADSRLGVPRLALSPLYVDPALAYLRARGAILRLGQPVQAVELDGEGARITGVVLRGGERIAASTVVAAVPPRALLELLPAALRRHLVFQDVAKLETSPIVNLWARVSRPLFDAPFVGLVGSPLHWLFDREYAARRRDRAQGTLLCGTMSGARAFVNDSPQALREFLVGELGRHFPGVQAEIRAFRAIKEKRATISHAAGTYQRRPTVRSPIAGLLLAGDWVRTGLPATIESAVRSGHLAAAAACE